VLPQSRCWSRSRSEVALGELVAGVELVEVAVDVMAAGLDCEPAQWR
jgi:hypothetical protein